MATTATAPRRIQRKDVREFTYIWEGFDRSGRNVRGEMKAASETVVSTNLRHGRDDVAVYEIGKGYGAIDGQTPHEWWRLGFALTGSAEPAAWNRPARPYDLDDAKGVIELLCRRLDLPVPTYTPLPDDPSLHPGRTARVNARAYLMGRVGEVHPALIDGLDLRADRIIVAELAIAGLASGRLPVTLGSTPSRFPAADRDLAVVVAGEVAAGAVADSIRHHGGELLRSVELFDVYRGRPLDETDKSLAWRLTFATDDRTLADAEVDQAMGAIAAGLATDVGGRLRA